MFTYTQLVAIGAYQRAHGVDTTHQVVKEALPRRHGDKSKISKESLEYVADFFAFSSGEDGMDVQEYAGVLSASEVSVPYLAI